MSVWIAVDDDGSEWVYNKIPTRGKNCFEPQPNGTGHRLSGGDCEDEVIYFLIGRRLTWKDEPVEIVENVSVETCRRYYPIYMDDSGAQCKKY